ncbi:MAG: helix-turn-helix transcriptional regulator [Lentisphaeria bacterium]
MTLVINKDFAPQEAELQFVAIFEERIDFTRVFTLPYNTLVGVMEDDGSDASRIEHCTTHETWIRRQGYLYFTPPNLPVLYTSRSNLHYVAVHFRFELCPGVDIFSGLDHWLIDYSPAEVAELFALFRLNDRVRSLSGLKEFCLRFCNRHWPAGCEYDFHRQQRFLPVLREIRESATAATTVRELAARLNLRPEVFCREFTAVFRQSPKTFLQRELATKAAFLLRQRNCRVKEAAEQLGFSSEFYFSKFFKRQTGISPSTYRHWTPEAQSQVQPKR